MTEIRTITLRLPQVGQAARPARLESQLGLPEWGVLLAIFLVWTNAIVVGTRFHGIPTIAGGIVPLLLAIPIALAVFGRGERIWLTPALLWAFGLVVVQFVGSLFAADPVASMKELVPLVSEGAFLYLLVSNAIRSEKTLHWAILTLVAAGALMGALLAYQQVTQSYDHDFYGFAQLGGSVGGDGEAQQPRMAGPIGEKNTFAQIMAMLIPLALTTLALSKTRAHRALAVAALLLIMFGTAMPLSRGVMVGLVLTLVIMAAIGAIPMRYLALTALAGALVLMVIPQYATRLSSIANVLPGSGVSIRNTDAATRGRMTEMEGSFLMFVDHPVIGVGPAMSRKHYRKYAQIVGGKIWFEDRYSHSLYLGLAAEHGLVGLTAFAGVILMTWRSLQRVRTRFRGRYPERAQLATGLLMGVVVYLTTGIFLHAAYARYFWLYLGLTGAATHVLMLEAGRLGRVALESPSEPSR